MKIDKKIIQRIAISLFVSVVVLLIMAYRYHFYFFFLRIITPRTKNPANDQEIRNLHPTFGLKVARFIRDLEKQGANVIITDGLRSWEEQTQLYNSGQTPAQAGNSFHNYGQAVDINVNGLKMGSSYADWLPVADYIKKKYGLRWGGDFVNNWDKVHFDNGNKYKIEQLKALYNANQVVNKNYVKIL